MSDMNGNGRPHLTIHRNAFVNPRHSSKCWRINPNNPVTRCILEPGHEGLCQGWYNAGSGAGVYSWDDTPTPPKRAA